MKKKVTRNQLNGYTHLFRCGYCDLQYIFKYREPTFYNAGIYGWNYDVYTWADVAITTGYRNTVGKRIPNELIEKYTEKAKAILNDGNFTNYDETKNALDLNLQAFIRELTNN